MFVSPTKLAEQKRLEARELEHAKSMDRSEVLAGREPKYEAQKRAQIEARHVRAAKEKEEAEAVEERKVEILERERIEQRAREQIESERRMVAV